MSVLVDCVKRKQNGPLGESPRLDYWVLGLDSDSSRPEMLLLNKKAFTICFLDKKILV